MSVINNVWERKKGIILSFKKKVLWYFLVDNGLFFYLFKVKKYDKGVFYYMMINFSFSKRLFVG